MVWMDGTRQSTPNTSVGLTQKDTGNTTSNPTLEDNQKARDSPMETEDMPILQYVDVEYETNDLLVAYQSNTETSVTPIEKDGIGVCEKCGAIAVKHTFHAKERRFCSMACTKDYSSSDSQSKSSKTDIYAGHFFKIEDQENFEFLALTQPLPPLVEPSQQPEVDDHSLLLTLRNVPDSYSWDSQLLEADFVAAPVTCFKQDPLCDIWHEIIVDIKVEVENTDCDSISDEFSGFWVATVVKIIGCMALLRYEGFDDDDSKDFWVSLWTNQIQPIGWCAINGKPLIPPLTIQDKYSDWKGFLRKRLTGTRTLPSNFTNKVMDGSKCRFHCGLNLEVVDKDNIFQVKLAVINKIIGKRLNVRYFDMPADDIGFWCHEDSHLLHPVGWAKKVGHPFLAPKNHLKRISNGIPDPNDAPYELFTPIQTGSTLCTIGDDLCDGMKLEAIDPLDLTSICVATVMRVLKCGYVMIRIETYDADAGDKDWFCYHINSPYIFPAGFCEKNDIPLKLPKGYDLDNFTWKDYLEKTNTRVVDEKYFNNDVPQHGFEVGMKVEATDLMDPQLVCVATIAKVSGRLLRVHFDGWNDDYDQWVDCDSPDIYPVGWCQSVGHKLEGPHVTDQKPIVATRKPSKVSGWGRRKKRKMKHCLLRKFSKIVKNDHTTNTKIILRFADGTNEQCPIEWGVSDVVQFLRMNGCDHYCDAFNKAKVNGKAMLNLSEENILELTGGFIKPALKIHRLIEQLKIQFLVAAPTRGQSE